MPLWVHRVRHDHGVRRRLIGVGAIGVALLLVAGSFLLLQVTVHSSGINVSCGAPFDVISGRASWQQWFGEDLRDPRISTVTPLVRTEACPTAVNRRTTIAGVLGAAGLALVTAAAMPAARDRRRRTRPIPLRALGAWLTVVGAALTVAGVFGLCVLLANPDAALFLYVDRWVIGIIGMLVLIPAIALAAGGRALMLVADTRDEDRVGHESS